MKATQLDCILREYEHIDEQKAIMTDTIERKKDVSWNDEIILREVLYLRK